MILILCAGGGALVYFLAAYLLRLEEARFFFGLFRKLGKGEKIA